MTNGLLNYLYIYIFQHMFCVRTYVHQYEEKKFP